MTNKKTNNKKNLDIPKIPSRKVNLKDNYKKNKPNKKIKEKTLIIVRSFIAIAISIIGMFRLGFIGEFLNNSTRCLIGYLNTILFGVIIIISIYSILKKKKLKLETETIISMIFLLLATILIISIPKQQSIGFYVLQKYFASLKDIYLNVHYTEFGCGGIIGALIYSLFSSMFSIVGVYIVIVLSFVASGVIYSGTKKDEKESKPIVNKEQFKIPNAKGILECKNDLKNENKQREIEKTIIDKTIPEEKTKELIVVSTLKETKIQKEKIDKEVNESKKSKTEQSLYKLPSCDLLSAQKEKQNNANNKKAAIEAGVKLIDVLNQFGVNATLMETHIGPSVTKFEIKPDTGVKVNRISNLQNDIKMALAAKDIRIEAPIPSKNAVGIEIPNVDKTIVGLKELLKKVPEKLVDKKLLFVLGEDLSGQPVYGELNKMPHLLIAGATGSGKSVCVNSIITSILMRTAPDEVKLLLIDPKKVEFSCYKNVPHLIGPIINEADEANAALKIIVEEMDRRYNIFAQSGVRNISGYNEKVDKFPDEGHKKMPWIVVIIDELADLMLVAAKDVEASIQRITQLARAAGIHLVVATQRPSVDVITGIIKANIPSRIAFAVSSTVDSRTILDQQGAERLLGMGDMLYIPAGEQHPIRVQGVYVSDDEVNKICEFVANQCRPQFDDAFIRLQMVKDTIGFVSGKIDDPLYEEAKEFVVDNQKASTSLLQRKFSIGYQRAARLIDLMEDNGVIGPARGSKPREVYLKKVIEEDKLE